MPEQQKMKRNLEYEQKDGATLGGVVPFTLVGASDAPETSRGNFL